MNRQEKHQQKKEHERDAKDRREAAYEESHQAERAPYNSVVLLVVGTALVMAVVLSWTLGWW